LPCLATAWAIKVEHQPLFNREQFEGTEIRKKIQSGENWKPLVPKSVAAIISQRPPSKPKRKKHRRCYH